MILLVDFVEGFLCFFVIFHVNRPHYFNDG